MYSLKVYFSNRYIKKNGEAPIYIVAYMRRRRVMFHTGVIRKISRALNIPITWFFEDVNRIEVLKEPGVQYYQNKDIIDHKDLIIEDLKEQLSRAHKEKEKAWEQVEFLRKIIEEKL